MKLSRFLTLGIALTLASCNSEPVGPTDSPPKGGSGTALAALERVSSNAVATTRLRLRLVGGGDLMTGLQTGQTINVPLNVKLDVWAEIERLENDRARLVVDWGNGNDDFSGCGACRVENVYTRPGRYTLTARVLDLNGSTGTPVTTATVAINVVDDSLSCDDVVADFETSINPFPVSSNGVSFTVQGNAVIVLPSSFYAPVLVNRFVIADNASPITITFPSDRDEFSAGVVINPGDSMKYQALNSDGGIVASGVFNPALPIGSDFGGILAFGGPRFRRVILASVSYDWGLDNVRGACR